MSFKKNTKSALKIRQQIKTVIPNKTSTSLHSKKNNYFSTLIGFTSFPFL